MRNKIIGILFFLSVTLHFAAHAQKEGNIWTFPDHCSMNFNDTVNIIVDSCADGYSNGAFPFENNCTISDMHGSLFCYTSGLDVGYKVMNVYDRTHHVMPNGSNLYSKSIFVSLLVQYPGIDSLIYLFYLGRDSVNTNNWKLFFLVINKNLNNGLGDLTIRDSLIFYDRLSGDKLAACKHANGRDWWLCAFDRDLGYLIYLITPFGITQQNIQAIGSNSDSLFFGKMVFSNDGSKLMSVTHFGFIDVFDFDRCTGTLSNYRDIGEHLYTEPYQYANAAFSPNGNLIYVSTESITKVFYQWNLNAGDINAIRASKTLLNQYQDTGSIQWTQYYSHNLAPDGKIYIPLSNNYGLNSHTTYTSHLDVIEYPDSVGLACHYVRQGFDLGNHYVQGYLPNMPYYGLGADSGSICDSLIAVQSFEVQSSKMEVYPNPSSGIFSLRIKDLNDKIVSLKVEDILGKEVFSSKNFSSAIDINRQPSGIYFVHATTQKKKIFVAKVVKE